MMWVIMLVDFDGNYIQIFNVVIYKGIIKNFIVNFKMCGQFILGIGYDVDCQQVQWLVLQFIGEYLNVFKEFELLVLVDEFGLVMVNLKVYFWINVESISVIKMVLVLMCDLVELFIVQGISMLDDVCEVIFLQGVLVIMVNNQEQVSE